MCIEDVEDVKEEALVEEGEEKIEETNVEGENKDLEAEEV